MTRSFTNRGSLFALVALMLVSGPVVAADGQVEPVRSGYEYSSPTAFHQPVAPLPAEFGFSQHHSSTAAEGFLRGKAALIHAIGNFRLAESQAAILFEQGRALDRENDLRQTQALHAQQIMWRAAREEKEAHREARLAEGRTKLALRKATVHRAAYQLSPADVNFVTGEINWPVALAGEKFQAGRERMDELFRELATYGGDQPGVAAEVARVSDAMSRVLRDDLRSLTREDYLAAQKFLLGLKFAASDAQG